MKPEKCYEGCPSGPYVPGYCTKCARDESGEFMVLCPGPDCQFVQLAAKDAALAKIRGKKIDYTNPEEYFGFVQSALKEVK